jgi:hypothetical protein
VTESEPDPAERIADAIRCLLERTAADAEAEADGPVVFFVLERDGVPQGIGGPYRAEPEAETEPEAEL